MKELAKKERYLVKYQSIFSTIVRVVDDTFDTFEDADAFADKMNLKHANLHYFVQRDKNHKS